jgi:hypothetical protein
VEPIPVLLGRLDRLPVGIDPAGERGERCVEGPAQIRQLIEGGGLDTLAV